MIAFELIDSDYESNGISFAIFKLLKTNEQIAFANPDCIYFIDDDNNYMYSGETKLQQIVNEKFLDDTQKKYLPIFKPKSIPTFAFIVEGSSRIHKTIYGPRSNNSNQRVVMVCKEMTIKTLYEICDGDEYEIEKNVKLLSEYVFTQTDDKILKVVGQNKPLYYMPAKRAMLNRYNLYINYKKNTIEYAPKKSLSQLKRALKSGSGQNREYEFSSGYLYDLKCSILNFDDILMQKLVAKTGIELKRLRGNISARTSAKKLMQRMDLYKKYFKKSEYKKLKQYKQIIKNWDDLDSRKKRPFIGTEFHKFIKSK